MYQKKSLVIAIVALILPCLCGCTDTKGEENRRNAQRSLVFAMAQSRNKDLNELYYKNVYLDAIVEWNPQPVGSSRFGWGSSVGSDGIPLQTEGAFGPPEGGGSYSSSGDYVCVGINGSAAFRFREGHYIFNGDGPDFMTFTSTFAWGSAVDGLCCELARVEVSEDLAVWYYNSDEAYDTNPDPAADNDNYVYDNVRGLHGNNPTWANYTKSVQAQEIQEVGGVEKWVDIPGVFVQPDFGPKDPHLGGVQFDLSTFKKKGTGEDWPADGKMRYIRITDDSSILDGQDWNKAWCLGANMEAAMGINTEEE